MKFEERSSKDVYKYECKIKIKSKKIWNIIKKEAELLLPLLTTRNKKMNFLYVLFFIAIVRAETTKDESKEKRDTFLPAIRQTIVRPAMLNRVVQPIIQDVVQPVVHQKTFQTIVNPVSMTHHVAQPMMQSNFFANRFVKRSADQKEESKEKRDLFLLNSVFLCQRTFLYLYVFAWRHQASNQIMALQ